MLSVTPGREDDWRYWYAALGVNARVMRAIDGESFTDDYVHLRRPLPRSVLAAYRARRATPCAAQRRTLTFERTA